MLPLMQQQEQAMSIDIKALAKQAGGTSYINRHYLGMTAVAFGPVALEEFVRLVREQAFHEAAEVCDKLGTKYRDLYKGRTDPIDHDAHYNPHTDCKSDGAWECQSEIEDLK